MRVAPREELHGPAAHPDELAGHFPRQARLVRVADGAATDSRDRGHERDRDQQEPDPAEGDLDAGAVAAGPTRAPARRAAFEASAAPGVGPVEEGRGDERHRRQPDRPAK